MEEEEQKERMMRLLDRYAARKRKRQLSSRIESDPAQTAGPSLPDFQDLDEEEQKERMMRLLDRYAARKRKRQLSSRIESDPA